MNDQANRHQRRLPPAERWRAQDRSRDDLIISVALELLGEKGGSVAKIAFQVVFPVVLQNFFWPRLVAAQEVV